MGERTGLIPGRGVLLLDTVKEKFHNLFLVRNSAMDYGIAEQHFMKKSGLLKKIVIVDIQLGSNINL
jgi:hypothetical protein